MSASVVRGFTIAEPGDGLAVVLVGVTNATPSASSRSRPRAVVVGRPAVRAAPRAPSARARSGARASGRARISSAALAGDVQRVLDRLGVGARPVRCEREPERQPARPPGEVDGVVGRVPARCRLDRVEVAGVLRVGRARQLGPAVQERAAVERREEPLVRVDDERVGALDPGERGRAPTGAASAAPPYAPSTCNHRPRSVAHVGDAGQVVDRRRGSSCRRSRRRRTRPRRRRGRALLEGAPVSRPRASGATARTSASMTAAAAATEEWAWSVARQPQPARRAPCSATNACRAATSAERLPTRAALHEAAARRVRHARPDRPASAGPGSRRNGAAALRQLPAYIGVAATAMSNSLAAWAGRGGDERQEARVLDRDAGRGERLGEDLQGRLAADALLGDRGSPAAARVSSVRRARRRERPGQRAQALAHVGEHVVGHPLGLVVTGASPPGRQRLGRRCSGSRSHLPPSGQRRPSVTSSAYSRSPPTGSPLASRVTRARPRRRSAR